MVQTCPVVERSGIQMPFEYRTTLSGFRMVIWYLWKQTIRKPDKVVLYTVTIRIPDTRIPDSSEYRTYCMSGFRRVITIQKPDKMSGFRMVWVHRHQNDGLPFENRTFLSGFQMVWDHRCLNAIRKPDIFIRFSKGIQKPDHSTTGHVWTIPIPD